MSEETSKKEDPKVPSFLVRFILSVRNTVTGRLDDIRFDCLTRAESLELVHEMVKKLDLPSSCSYTAAPILESNIADLPEVLRRHLNDTKVELVFSAGPGTVSPAQPPPCPD